MNNESFEKYNAGTHILGRVFSVITLVLLVGAPFMIGLFLGAMPDLPAVGKGFLSVGIIWFVRPCWVQAAAIWPLSREI